MHSDVVNYLSQKLLDSAQNGSERDCIKKFISILFEDNKNIDAIRLGYCIAIDVLNNLVESNHYAKIILSEKCNDTNIRNEDICKKFHDALEETDDYRTFSKHTSELYKSDEKITTLIQSSTFLFLFGTQLLTPLLHEDNTDHEIFLSEIEIRPIRKKMKNWPDGISKKYFWLMPLDSLEEILKNSMKGEILPAINMLGLIPDFKRVPAGTKPNYLYCLYPKDFITNHKTYQPNATNTFWSSKNGLFLSFIDKDGWGRTYPTFGLKKLNEEIKERIHQPITEIEIEINYFGQIDNEMEPDTSGILNRAKDRFLKRNCEL